MALLVALIALAVRLAGFAAGAHHFMSWRPEFVTPVSSYHRCKGPTAYKYSLACTARKSRCHDVRPSPDRALILARSPPSHIGKNANDYSLLVTTANYNFCHWLLGPCAGLCFWLLIVGLTASKTRPTK